MKLRPRAEAFIFKRNRVLCAFRKDYVVFPGGGIDNNESAKDAAIRETFEEAGRKLTNCTVAHPPSAQIWPKDYVASSGEKWKDGYEGGFTYWMTGSSSDNPVPPAYRHADYEGKIDWHPVKDVIERLNRGLTGPFGDDTKIRKTILETHLAMQQKKKISGLVVASMAKYPVLGAH